MSTSTQPKVAVSYSWKEEREGPHAGAVERFCTSLREAGVEVVRDVDRMQHGESIAEFMRSLGTFDFLCVFLSDAYFKSPNCMYELLIGWQRSKDNPKEFRQRIKAWVMPGTERIDKIEGRVKFLEFWQEEKKRVEPLITKHAKKGMSGATIEEYRRIKAIGEEVDAILQFFADSLSPGTAGEFQTWIQEQFPNASGEVDEALLDQVYENTITEIETVLNRHPKLREFLSNYTTGLIQEEASGWKLSGQARNHPFDICPHMEKMSKKVDSFYGQPSDWKALEEITGGLVILGIDREWIVRQKDLARTGSTDYPSDAEIIHLDHGRQVNFLHLVASALADGRARLETAFGKPALDENRIPEPAQVMRGITATDQERELKLHLIRFVLGPKVPLDESDDHQIDQLFTRTKRIFFAALWDDHKPFVGAGEIFKKLEKTIREQLEVQDLLLIHPSGEDPELLLIDYVRVLRFLGKIFDAVQANASS